MPPTGSFEGWVVLGLAVIAGVMGYAALRQRVKALEEGRIQDQSETEKNLSRAEFNQFLSRFDSLERGIEDVRNLFLNFLSGAKPKE